MAIEFGKVVVEKSGSSYRITGPRSRRDSDKGWNVVAEYEFEYETITRELQVTPKKWERVQEIPAKLEGLRAYLESLSQVLLNSSEIEGRLLEFERQFKIKLAPRPASPRT